MIEAPSDVLVYRMSQERGEILDPPPPANFMLVFPGKVTWCKKKSSGVYYGNLVESSLK